MIFPCSSISQISHIKSLISQSSVIYPSTQSDSQGVSKFPMTRNCQEPTPAGSRCLCSMLFLEQLAMGWTIHLFLLRFAQGEQQFWNNGYFNLNFWFTPSWLGYIGKSDLTESLRWIQNNRSKVRRPKHAFRSIAHRNDHIELHIWLSVIMFKAKYGHQTIVIVIIKVVCSPIIYGMYMIGCI